MQAQCAAVHTATCASTLPAACIRPVVDALSCKSSLTALLLWCLLPQQLLLLLLLLRSPHVQTRTSAQQLQRLGPVLLAKYR
jgi:hypothetical protein